MNNKFLKLTNTVYKVLEFFPEADPLKNRAKDKALVIMEDLTLINEGSGASSGWASFNKEKIKAKISEDIDILLGYLWVGKSQGWLNSANCIIISNEYEKIKKEISPIVELTIKLPGIEDYPEILEPETPEVKETGAGQSTRQTKILDFLVQKGKAQVMDLQAVLPDITKRTIRRDLDELLESGRIARFGEFNQVFYQIKK